MNKSELKIALVSLQKDAEKDPPIGLVYLATYLRDIVGLSQDNIKIFDMNFFDVEKEVDEFNPNIIGISAMSINYEISSRFAQKIKTKTKIPIILGGVHISTLPESFRNCFDVGVIGEGEETLKELVELYLKKQKFSISNLKNIRSIVYYNKEKLIQTKLREPLNLDSLPLPDFRFVHKDYFKPKEIPGLGSTGVTCYLLSSRGCPYRCVFCSTSRFWGKMRFHSPEYIAKYVEKTIKDYNANFVNVLDDLFSVSPDRLKKIKTEFDKRGILEKLNGISSTVRANLVNDDLCKAMKELKIKIVNFGFESGSDKVLSYLKAGSVSVEMNKKALLICKKYNFNVYGSLMYGSPGEKIQDMKKTNDFIDFCLKNKASYVWSFVATPFPATPFWDIAKEKGYVSNNMNFDLLNLHSVKRPMLLDDDISTEEFNNVFSQGMKKLRRLKLKLVFDFVLKNPINTTLMVAKEPVYYFNRIYNKVFKQ